ncbi:MAG: 3-deoxy-manno-octulosonate cytidylyltransferase [Wenzhouxiangellaceae bacterium]|nr:3-deoxy-manno-octulosonate cytidylyltransferase [Wenzhouxiangellaceae bacterium]
MIAFHVLIPARLESSRLPEKMLADVAGKPLVVRVWERARSSGAQSVHVATDHARIADAVLAAGGQVVRTGSDHDSGTSRLAEAVDRLGLDDSALVVNVQGDEPAVPVACIRQLAQLLQHHPETDLATLWMPITIRDEWQDPNVVKLLTDHQGLALYFSRAPIPAMRASGWPERLARRHVGMYGYRAGSLRCWSELPTSALAEAEALEQLRALQAGWKIICEQACAPIPAGVDTLEDLEAMRRWFGEHGAIEGD